MMDTTTTVVLGRVSHTEWSQHLPTSDDPFAQLNNPVEKLVVSSTPGPELSWSNARLLEVDLVTALTALRETDGGDTAVCGSTSVVRQLLFAGVLGELVLVTHPVVAGSGRHLFTADDPVTPLQLLGVGATPRGDVLARYGPAGTDPAGPARVVPGRGSPVRPVRPGRGCRSRVRAPPWGQ